MRLLIITQKVDCSDSILGFFHRWIEEFAGQFSEVSVICLEKGEYELPGNVKILSLGKEERVSKLQYLRRFYEYIWSLRNEYDSVFVHMNEEYVILGSPVWLIFGKKVFFWRNHKKGTWITRLAAAFSEKIYATSPDSFTMRFKKAKIMPVGIKMPREEELDGLRIPNSILFLGRISPVKKIALFIDSLNILHANGREFTASIIGDTVNPEDESYKDELVRKSADLIKAGKLEFRPGVPSTETKNLYRSYSVVVNLTDAGSLDKTIFSAMSNKTPVLVVNPYLKSVLANTFMAEEANPKIIAEKIDKILSLDQVSRKSYGELAYKHVAAHHSLGRLVEIVKEDMTRANRK